MSAHLDTVAQMWARFSGMVMPADAPAIQVQEMRRAFYAGCHAVLNAQVSDVVAATSDEEVELWLAGIHSEVAAFFSLIQEGRA